MLWQALQCGLYPSCVGITGCHAAGILYAPRQGSTQAPMLEEAASAYRTGVPCTSDTVAQKRPTVCVWFAGKAALNFSPSPRFAGQGLDYKPWPIASILSVSLSAKCILHTPNQPFPLTSRSSAISRMCLVSISLTHATCSDVLWHCQDVSGYSGI